MYKLPPLSLHLTMKNSASKLPLIYYDLEGKRYYWPKHIAMWLSYFKQTLGVPEELTNEWIWKSLKG